MLKTILQLNIQSGLHSSIRSKYSLRLLDAGRAANPFRFACQYAESLKSSDDLTKITTQKRSSR